MKKPTDVLAALVDRADWMKFGGCTRDFSKKTSQEHYEDSKKVGELVLRSSENDRELLKQLTVDDINGVRYPPYDYQHYIVDEKTKKSRVDPTFRPNRKRGPVLIKF